MPAIDISRYKTPGTKPKKEKFSFSAVLNREISFTSGQLPDKRKESFYLELSTLLQSGVDIKTSLELILVEQGQAKDKLIFTNIKNQVIAGSALSEAIRNAGKFSDYEYYSIRIGEETGKIGEVLTDLADYYKSKIRQRRKITGAITYPVIVFMTSMAAVFFMINFVVPMFADVFRRFGGKLPWITELILSFSGLFERYFIYCFILVLAGFIFLFMNRRAEWFRRTSSGLILKLPLIGNLVRKVYLARFANTMRLLVSTDIPLLRAIHLVRQMISFYPIEKSLLTVEEDILRGVSLYASLARLDFYPPKMVQLIKVGEEVNRLDYFFEKIASQYTEEIEYRTNTISSLLEPLIIIFLGLVVGVILIAMYLPMFQMSNGF